MKRKYLKMGAALMAAVMVMASPMTVRAAGVAQAPNVSWETIDDGEYEYAIPSIAETEDGGYVSATLEARWEEGASSFVEVQTGYEYRGCTVMDWNFYPPALQWWRIEGDGLDNWERIGDSSEFSYDEIYNFSLTYNGTVYPNCQLFVREIDMGFISYIAAVPQGYEGTLAVTVWGGKLENGEPVMDEASGLTFYLWGNGAAASATPAAEEQPAPAPETEEQPAPAPETVEQPASSSVTSEHGTVYVTKRGDNLKKIAKEIYGDQNLWEAIYEQNKDLIKNPNLIYANMQLILP